MKLALATLALLACDAQVDADYAGEPLVRLHGTAIGFAPADVADGAAVRWNPQRGSDLSAGPTVALPMEAAPPSGLSVLVLGEPPPDAYFAFDAPSPRLAEGALLLTQDGAPVGTTIDTVLVYVDGAVAAGSLAADYLGGTPAAGFHLYYVLATAEPGAAQAYLAMRCGGGDACRDPRRYRLELAPDDLATSLQFFRSHR
jgi:hypothetical protein